MTKINLKLNLTNYSKEELIELYNLKILTKSEITTELRSRGLSEWAVILMLRAA